MRVRTGPCEKKFHNQPILLSLLPPAPVLILLLIFDHITPVVLRNLLYSYRDMKCGRNCLSHAAQLPVLNGHKSSPTFHESSNISFDISNLCFERRGTKGSLGNLRSQRLRRRPKAIANLF